MISIRPDEISSVIKAQIEKYQAELTVTNTGTVLAVGDGIARIYGLQKAQAGELLDFGNDVYGLVFDLVEDHVGAVIMGDYRQVEEGDTVKTTGRIASVPVGEAMLGRVVNALGVPIDGKGPIATTEFERVDKKAPGIIVRKGVHQPVQTGIMAIDSMIPIGRGQRELIIGDRQTGKTAIAVDTILNQKGKDMVCVYVSIGQKTSTVARLIKAFEDHGAMEYTVVVVASPEEAAPMQYLAPFAGTAIGEFFMKRGQDVLCVYDDLTKQAWAYREMSLLLRRPPGREAYPGDVFYLHSRLLERAAKLNEAHGGGSLTALPIIETQAGDVSAYIPTNVISITDGQIFLETDLFNAGIRPAVNAGISVSRVGSSAQTKAMKKVAGKLRLELAQYRELAAFAQFASDLDKATQAQLARGQRLTELLKQPQYSPLSVGQQVTLIYSATSGLMDDIAVEEITRFRTELLAYLRANKNDLIEGITSKGAVDDADTKAIAEAIAGFKTTFFSRAGAR